MRTLAVLLIFAMTALPVQIQRFTFNNGGGSVDGDSVNILASVGESITGRADGDGTSIAAGFIVIESGGEAVDEDGDEDILPDGLGLLRATPNPFNSVCRIDFSLPDDRDVEITITGLDGRRLLTEKRRMDRGHHAFTWHADNVEAGVYLAGIKAGKEKAAVKIILVK